MGIGKIIRVFPRRTSYTPIDDLVFVGEPPLLRPEASEVHVSVTFTWDVNEGKRLAEAWRQYYEIVKLGGPAIDGGLHGEFVPGRYIKPGVIFTSRGCDKNCPWCLVPEREGYLKLLDVQAGNVIGDNNFLQTPRVHRWLVYQMLAQQKRSAVFSGGIQASLVTDEIAEEFRGLRIDSLFLAADTESSLRFLEKALQLLSFLPRRKLRCYVLVGYNGESIDKARERLEKVWKMGALPFAQLYQPPELWIDYGVEWKALAREWSRPAAMFAMHKEYGEVSNAALS